MKKLALSLFLCSAVTALMAQETKPADRAARMFEQVDSNKDGRLAKEELPERLRGNFSRVDADGDGFISKAEHQAVLARSQSAAKSATKKPIPSGITAHLDLPYADTENPRQRLDLYLPKVLKSEKPLPVVVFIHGGGWRGGDKAGGLGNVSRFVQSGDYAGVSVGYRLTGEAAWPAQIHDCKAAVRWIKAHAKEYGLDSGKIGVWGSSAGGHLVSMLGTCGDVKELEGTLGKHLDQSSQVQCVVNYYGPQNFLSMIRQPSTIDRTQGKDYPEALLLGGPVPERENVAREASPVTHVSRGDAPFFHAHGTKDPLVPFAQAEEIHAALKQAGVVSHLQQMTNGGHGFFSPILNERVQQFFDLYLRDVSAEIVTPEIVVEGRK